MYLFGRIRGGRGMVQVRPDSLVLSFSVLAGRDKAAASRRRVLIRQQLGYTQLNYLVLNASVLADWSPASLVNVNETSTNATMHGTRHISTARIALMRVNRYDKAVAAALLQSNLCASSYITRIPVGLLAANGSGRDERFVLCLTLAFGVEPHDMLQLGRNSVDLAARVVRAVDADLDCISKEDRRAGLKLRTSTATSVLAMKTMCRVSCQRTRDLLRHYICHIS
jgi:hypothetical protein